MHVPLVQAREINGSHIKKTLGSLTQDRPGAGDAAGAPAAVPAGSASCAGSEVDRKVELDTESDGIQAAIFVLRTAI